MHALRPDYPRPGPSSPAKAFVATRRGPGVIATSPYQKSIGITGCATCDISPALVGQQGYVEVVQPVGITDHVDGGHLARIVCCQ